MNLLPNLPPDVQAFLFVLATTPGVLLSQLEKWNWFKNLNVWQKLALQAGLSGLAAILLTILASPTLPSTALATTNSVYLVIVQVITAVAMNFGAHISINKVIKPAGDLIESAADRPKG